MHIVVVGLNYRTTPVEVRERFAITPERLPEAIRELKARKSVLECVIVGTCNRTELYAVVDRDHWCPKYVRDFLESWFDVPKEAFAPHIYVYEDDAAMLHLFRVACGLDSMVLGETQILGQVRHAFLLAQQEGATGTIFNMLFRQAVTVAKRAHAETGIGENAVSVSYAATMLGKRIFGSFRHKNVLIIGAGKMSELTVKHLAASGADRICVTNRTFERASQLAAGFGGEAFPIEHLRARLLDADVVISSTGSAETVLSKADVAEAMKQRPSCPLFMIDIAVPRDLDPGIHGVPGVYLYDIDDLEGIVEANLELRKAESLKIEAMISEEMHAFHAWYRSLGVGPVIRALQQKASDIHEETMESLRNKLPDLTEREWKMIGKLTKSMLNQMMHDPIQRVKEMAPQRRGEEALDYFAKLFDLEPLLAAEQADALSADDKKDQPAGRRSLLRSSLSMV